MPNLCRFSLGLEIPLFLAVDNLKFLKTSERRMLSKFGNQIAKEYEQFLRLPILYQFVID